MRITFFGAASEVTGSKHLVEIGARKILFDCGAYQGRRWESRERNKQLKFTPADVDAVIISHAHYDHVGLLPVLVRDGFRGTIYTTAATRDLTELILLDAAHLQEQDAEYANRHKLPDAAFVEPLYTSQDIPPVIARMKALPYVRDHQGWQTIVPGVELKFYDAGHILGSAVTILRAADGQESIAYTGDLGRAGQPLLHNPEPVLDPVSTLILESTYGSRLHHPVSVVMDELVAVITQAIKVKGRVLVPAFSLGRTQALIYLLHELVDQGRIPRIPIVVDSPLASRITDAFMQHQADYDAEVGNDFGRKNENPLVFRNLTFTHTVEESKSLNVAPGPIVIISASGMVSGGRIMHHLKNHISDPTTTVLFTGYQAEHTPGRRLLKGTKTLFIHGQSIPVRATIASINDLSAHADADELAAYAASILGLHNIFLVHGEPDRAANLREALHRVNPLWQVTIPTLDQMVTVETKTAPG